MTRLATLAVQGVLIVGALVLLAGCVADARQDARRESRPGKLGPWAAGAVYVVAFIVGVLSGRL